MIHHPEIMKQLGTPFQIVWSNEWEQLGTCLFMIHHPEIMISYKLHSIVSDPMSKNSWGTGLYMFYHPETMELGTPLHIIWSNEKEQLGNRSLQVSSSWNLEQFGTTFYMVR